MSRSVLIVLVILLAASGIACAQVSAQLGNQAKVDAPLTPRPKTVIISHTCILPQIEPGESTTCTVTLNQNTRVGTGIPATIVKIFVPLQFAAPAEAPVPPGQRTVTYTVTHLEELAQLVTPRLLANHVSQTYGGSFLGVSLLEEGK